MIWLKSTTQKEWVINGKIIPRCITPENKYLTLNDNDYEALARVPVLASLIKSNAILVLHKEPTELKNSIQGLNASNAELVARNTELQAQIAKLQEQIAKPQKQDSAQVDIEAIKEEAVASIKAEAVKELQEKQSALDTANAQIEKLKKQLAKAKASAE